MTQTTTVLDALVGALQRVGAYNSNDQTAPAAIIWTDAQRQWEPLLPRLRDALPLLTLGPYRPEERAGPAYWLRAVLAGALADDIRLPTDSPPVIYLPGYSRQQLRAVEDCPPELAPLAELQYRGVLWTQKNARDWTIAAFLGSEDGGLGIEVGSDNATKQAMQRALSHLANEPIDRLRHESPLRAEFFDALLNPDEARSLLQWLNDPAAFRASLRQEEWDAFRDSCRRRYKFDPEKDGPVTAAAQLGKREAHWDTVWKRFAESPGSYSTLPDRLRQARPTGPVELFDRSESWPQENEDAESDVRKRLLGLAALTPTAARDAIAELEQDHGHRRDWVWATLGKAPLARSLAHLARLAKCTEKQLTGANTADIVVAYTEWGWRADASVLDALAAVEDAPDAQAVRVAVRALYHDWLDNAVRAFQRVVLDAKVTDSGARAQAYATPPGTCVLFSDGLRHDLARKLVQRLEGAAGSADMSWTLAAIPSITSTAKAAISPVADQLNGGDELTPRAPGGTVVDVNVLRKLLVDAGFQVLRADETGDPAGRAWTELGDIDQLGHSHGLKMAGQIDSELRAIAARMLALLDAGWERVVVITDHGWLLMPGGLPKVDLPEHLTVIRKGRCARLKANSTTDQPTALWRFDPQVRLAVAPGIGCYTANQEYEHGGISPQECVVPIVTVTRAVVAGPVSIDSIVWRGMRCAVTIAGAGPGLQIDLRTKAADEPSSLCGGPKAVANIGTASLLVADEDRQGEAVLVVLLASDGTIRAQSPTVVGG